MIRMKMKRKAPVNVKAKEFICFKAYCLISIMLMFTDFKRKGQFSMTLLSCF